MKDLCALDLLPDLAEAGVRSLKIEGRMKDWHYTEGVVSVYRKYLDLLEEKGPAAYRVEADDRKLLSALFDRGGFTDGYFRRHNGPEMIVLERPEQFKTAGEEITDRLDRLYGREIRPIPVKAEAEIRVGAPCRLTLTAPSGIWGITCPAICRSMSEGSGDFISQRGIFPASTMASTRLRGMEVPAGSPITRGRFSLTSTMIFLAVSAMPRSAPRAPERLKKPFSSMGETESMATSTERY